MNYIEGKHAIITGISKGIGRALAEKLLEKGAMVTGWGLNAPEYSHPHLRFIKCDVSQQESVQQAWTETQYERPSVDFLVNNAGFGYFSLVQDFSPAQFQKMWEVNMQGAFLVTQVVVPAMIAGKSGHILNISSVAGKVGAAYGTGYNTTKWAMAGFSESLFHELRGKGIKVTTVFPGSTQTHFFDEIPGVTPNEFMLDPAELAQVMLGVMDTSPNFLVREIEMRPLNSKSIH